MTGILKQDWCKAHHKNYKKIFSRTTCIQSIFQICSWIRVLFEFEIFKCPSFKTKWTSKLNVELGSAFRKELSLFKQRVFFGSRGGRKYINFFGYIDARSNSISSFYHFFFFLSFFQNTNEIFVYLNFIYYNSFEITIFSSVSVDKNFL